MKINKAGVVLFVVSSVVSLLVLELGLRASGYTYKHSRKVFFDKERVDSRHETERDYEKFQRGDAEESGQIWAIGDSFTNSGNVSALESYPAFLYEFVNKNNLNYSVTNLGQCEDPTWGVLERLKQLLKERKSPEVLIVLVGASDYFYYNFSGLDPLVQTREKQNTVDILPLKRPWYTSLRVYKAYRHIRLNLINKNISGGESISSEVQSELEKLYKGMLAAGTSEEEWSKYKKKSELLLDNYRSYVDGDRTEFELSDNARFVLNVNVIPQVRFFTSKLDHDKALEVLMRFAKDYPDFFWSDKRNNPFPLHTMLQIARFQSKYTSDAMAKILQQSTEQNISLRKSKLYLTAASIFKQDSRVEHKVQETQRKTWNEIYNLSQKYNFKIVVQTYATDFTNTNNLLREVANKYNLPLVDNNKLFKETVKKYGRKEIFADDNHFLPLGYKIQAKNIFQVLKNEVF